MKKYNQKTINPFEIAKTFEPIIKEIILKKFSIFPNKLKLLLEDKNGAYLSQEEPNTLCCFVLGKENGFLYLVTGKIKEDGKKLTNLKVGIIS